MVPVYDIQKASLIARFLGPQWGTSGADRTQVDPMLAPGNLLSGFVFRIATNIHITCVVWNNFGMWKHGFKLWFVCKFDIVEVIICLSFCLSLDVMSKQSKRINHSFMSRIWMLFPAQRCHFKCLLYKHKYLYRQSQYLKHMALQMSGPSSSNGRTFGMNPTAWVSSLRGSKNFDKIQQLFQYQCHRTKQCLKLCNSDE